MFWHRLSAVEWSEWGNWVMLRVDGVTGYSSACVPLHLPFAYTYLCCGRGTVEGQRSDAKHRLGGGVCIIRVHDE